MYRVRDGFTLVELIVVLFILGLAATFAAPRIDITKFRVNSAVQSLGTTMLAAQRQAVTQQHDIVVLFDTTAHLLRIHEDRNNDGAVGTGEHVRPVTLGEQLVFGRGPALAMSGLGSSAVTFAKRVGGKPAVVFHRDGSASEVGGFYLTSLRAKRDNIRPEDARAVSLARATGRASWFRYRSDGWVKLF